MSIVNSTVDIQDRVHSGKVTWLGPMMMLISRSLLAVICQVLVYAVFFSGRMNGWDEAGEWWRIYGTLIDLGGIILVVWLTQKEGIRLFDLGSYRREGWGRDVLSGLGLCIPLLLAFAVPTVVLEIIFYKGRAPVPGTGLPVFGSLYALVIWPVIWAFTEDNVYFGYCLPRIEVLTDNKWLAVIIVSVFTAAQHVFLPLRFEWQWFISHFLGYIIGSVVTCLLYLRLRRLLPIHIAHWGLNLVGVIMVITSTLSR